MTSKPDKNPETRSYLQRDLKLLWGLAAARCSKCRVDVVAEATGEDGEAVLGQIAHILAHGDKGPRADRSMSADDRRKYPNLILLCGHCHTLVDKQPNTYKPDDLRGWKRDHEGWVRERLLEEMPDVGFAELEVVSAALVNNPTPITVALELTNPAEKMDRNGLTQDVLFEIQQGMFKSKEVSQFLVAMSRLDRDFPERLRSGFLTRYRELHADGVTGDALFVGLRSFAGANGSFRRQAAGLAVLVYLFETCEVFER